MKKFKPPRYTAKFLNNSFTDNNYFLRAVHVSLKYKCDSFKEGEDYPSNENCSTKRRNWEEQNCHLSKLLLGNSENRERLRIWFWHISHQKSRKRRQTSKSQTNHHYCLQFGFLTPDCLLNLETQQHFMSFSRVYEFLSFTLIVVYVSVTWQENVAQRIVLLSQHLKDSFVKPKQNAVKFLFANILWLN